MVTSGKRFSELFLNLWPNHGAPTPRYQLLTVLVWGLCVTIIFVPGGFLWSKRMHEKRLDEVRAASPMGRECMKCARPATQAQTYSGAGAVTVYFCPRHTPPKNLVGRASSYGDAMADWTRFFGWFILPSFYVIGFFRSLVQFITRGRRLSTTPIAAICSLVYLLIAWSGVFFSPPMDWKTDPAFLQQLKT